MCSPVEKQLSFSLFLCLSLALNGHHTGNTVDQLQSRVTFSPQQGILRHLLTWSSMYKFSKCGENRNPGINNAFGQFRNQKAILELCLFDICVMDIERHMYPRIADKLPCHCSSQTFCLAATQTQPFQFSFSPLNKHNVLLLLLLLATT